MAGGEPLAPPNGRAAVHAPIPELGPHPLSPMSMDGNAVEAVDAPRHRRSVRQGEPRKLPGLASTPVAEARSRPAIRLGAEPGGPLMPPMRREQVREAAV